MNKIKYSYIVPVYNSEKYIYETINSILKQNREDFEIIIVDDGSTDNTLEILNRNFEKKSKIKIYSQQNSGPLIARIHGVLKAKGEWILFVDSDDIVNKNQLSIIDPIVTNKNIECVIFKLRRFSNVSELLNVKDIPLVKYKMLDNDDLFNLFGAGKINSMCTKVIKKNVLIKDIKKNENNPYYISKKLTMGEDGLHTFNIIKNINNAIFLDKELYFYRKNLDSSVYTYSKESYNSLLLVERYLYSSLQLIDINIKIYKLNINKISKHYVGALFRYLAANKLIKLEEKKVINDFYNNELTKLLLNDRFVKLKYKLLMKTTKKPTSIVIRILNKLNKIRLKVK